MAAVDDGATARRTIVPVADVASTRAGVDAVDGIAAVMARAEPGAIAERDCRARPTGPNCAADDAVQRHRAAGRRCLDVQDPGNLGAIVRVAEAGGATGVLAAGASADPFGWKALRGSMGSALRFPIVDRVDDVGLAAAEARKRGCQIVATVPRGGRSLFDVDLRRADRRADRRRRPGAV